jgi:CRP/FNR family cyclic AMP-dependent transcriptional regulator
MNADDQAPDGELTGAQPGLLRAAADTEQAGHTEVSAAPHQHTRDKGTDATFWDLLSHADQAALQALGHASAFQARDVICTEGEQATDVLVLTSGWIKIRSVTRVLALRSQGDIVGELAGASAGYRTATVVAIGPVQALVVTYDRFNHFLDSSSGAGRAYRHVLTQRWRETTDMLRSRSVNNGAQRLASLLLDLAARHGTPAGPATAITIPLSQEEIASLIGTSRATVTRAFRDWRRLGLIRTTWHQITIKDTPGLRSIADGA